MFRDSKNRLQPIVWVLITYVAEVILALFTETRACVFCIMLLAPWCIGAYVWCEYVDQDGQDVNCID